MTAGTELRRILVIRHGALGDFVLSLGPFRAIRRHHPAARIVLLTTAPFRTLAEASGCFDEVWLDPRPKPWQPAALLALVRRLRGGRFERVYDLQTSGRSSLYFRAFPRDARPEWSGIAAGASHFDDNPERTRIHTLERQRAQLARAGIAQVPPPDLAFAAADLGRFGLPADYALLVPGGSVHRPEKRWPAEGYAEIARRLVAAGLRPAVAGTAADAAAARLLLAGCPQALDLSGRTDLLELASLARGARLALGNDTGPMHMAAVAGCRAVVLFSGASDPARTAPRGSAVTVLRREPLAALAVAEVWAALGLDPAIGRSP